MPKINPINIYCAQINPINIYCAQRLEHVLAKELIAASKICLTLQNFTHSHIEKKKKKEKKSQTELRRNKLIMM